MARLFGYVDVTDSGFIAAVFSIAFNPLFWNVVRAACVLSALLFLAFLCQLQGDLLWATLEERLLLGTSGGVSRLSGDRSVCAGSCAVEGAPGAGGGCDGYHRGGEGGSQHGMRKELGAELGREDRAIKPILQPPPTLAARQWSPLGLSINGISPRWGAALDMLPAASP